MPFFSDNCYKPWGALNFLSARSVQSRWSSHASFQTSCSLYLTNRLTIFFMVPGCQRYGLYSTILLCLSLDKTALEALQNSCDQGGGTTAWDGYVLRHPSMMGPENHIPSHLGQGTRPVVLSNIAFLRGSRGQFV